MISISSSISTRNASNIIKPHSSRVSQHQSIITIVEGIGGVITSATNRRAATSSRKHKVDKKHCFIHVHSA
jgi:hypothetical protein